jgi:hypothetical protein
MRSRVLIRFIFGDLIERWNNRPRCPAPEPEQPPGHAEAGMRAARRMMELVGVLHDRGYGGLRLRSGLAPSGCHWRGSVHAAKDPQISTGSFSTGAGPKVLFDWEGVEDLGLPALADRFLAQFSALAAAARHPDPAYLAWYRDMLARTAPAGLIYLYSDFTESGVGVLGCRCPEGIPAPPGLPG